MLPRAPRRSLIPFALAAALLAAAATAGIASATTTAHPAVDNPLRPGAAFRSGGAVPGLTGVAAQQEAGPAADRFRQLAADRDSRFAALSARAAPLESGVTAAAVLHTDWGVLLPQSKGVGLRATHSVFTGSQAITHGSDVVYAPTALPAGGACMEMTTAYTSSGPVLWAWNWCGGNDGVGKLVKIDSTFLSTYTTTVNGYPAYTTDVHQTTASNNTWAAYLYNYRTQAWDTFSTSSGTFDLPSYNFGWDMFEIYSTVDPATGNAYYCGGMNGRKFETSDLQIMVNGVWTAASPSYANLTSTNPSGSQYECPSLAFTVVHPNDHWIAQIGSAPPTSAPPTSSASTSQPPTTAPASSRPATSSPPANSGTGCAATYKVVGSWQGGFQGEIDVTNTRSTATSSWKVSFTFPNGQVITQIWGGALSQSGSSVTIGNADYNGSLAANATAAVGFLASGNGTNTNPTVNCAAS